MVLIKRASSLSLILLLAVPASASEVLVGFHQILNSSNPPDISAANVSGTFAMAASGTGGPRALLSSSDGFFGDSSFSTGPLDTAPGGTSNGVMALRSGDSRANITINNNTIETIALESIAWDHFVSRSTANGSDSWVLYYLGGDLNGMNPFDTLGMGTTVDEGFDWLTDNVPYDMNDYSVDITTMTDNELSPGESATFQLREIGTSGPPTMVDNLAIIGEVGVMSPTNPDGDYNNDGTVDLADYTLWRNNLGEANGTLPNDPNGTAIGIDQYNTWRGNFGAVASLSVSATAVPEPNSMAMLASLAGLALLRLRQK